MKRFWEKTKQLSCSAAQWVKSLKVQKEQQREEFIDSYIEEHTAHDAKAKADS